jgi:micrococcal nuclease
VIIRQLSLLVLLALVLTLPACAEDPVPTRQGRVSWIYDGDTLNIEPYGKVRLIGVDTPERRNSQRDKYLIKRGVSAARQRQVYQQAKEFNINRVKGRQVTLSFDEPQRDRHGRRLAYVQLPDGRLLNRVLIEQGLAVVYRRFSFHKKEDFLAAEAHAKNQKLGLWSANRDLP